MGYTMEKGKIVIWTVKRPEADKYPFQDDVTNYTDFYKNLNDRHPFATCFASWPESEKIQMVSFMLLLKEDKIILRSKQSHRNKHPRKRNV